MAEEVKVVLVAIVKNEIPYIQEFIQYYLKLGIYQFMFYDNSPTRQLHGLQSSRVIVHFLPGECKQLEAYNHFLRHFKQHYTHVAFFDIDEFLVLKKHPNINAFCADLIPQGALGINWYLFGNNGLTHYDPRPVVVRFTQREAAMNCCVKTIAKCQDLLEMGVHHPTQLAPHTTFRNIKGTEFSGPFNYDTDDKVAQLNHYVTKSNEELFHKIARGRADVRGPRNPGELVHLLECNAVEDTSARDFFLRSPEEEEEAKDQAV